MDEIDLRILRALQNDGRLSNVDLAEKVNLSPSPCLRRVKALEKAGVIRHYRAIVDREQVGLPMTVFVDITLDNTRDLSTDAFEKAMIDIPNVLTCHLVSGMADYRLEVVVPSLQHYEGVLKQIQAQPQVKSIHSNFAIRTVKNDVVLPLG